MTLPDYSKAELKTVTNDWLMDNRPSLFGTSHTAVLYAEHPFQTYADYWLDKRNGTRQPETDAMRRGKYLEASILEWFGETHNISHQPAQIYVRGHIVSIPDACCVQDNLPQLISIKTTARRTNKPEPYWIWQAQAEMMVTTAHGCWIVWLDGSMKLQSEYIAADPELYEDIWSKSLEFMESLQADEMPEWVARTADDIIRQHPNPIDEAVDGGEEAYWLVRNYWHAKHEADKYNKAAAELRDQLFALMKDHQHLADDTGNIVASTKARSGSKRFDSPKFKEQHPALYDEYLIQGAASRSLTIPNNIKQLIEDND